VTPVKLLSRAERQKRRKGIKKTLRKKQHGWRKDQQERKQRKKAKIFDKLAPVGDALP